MNCYKLKRNLYVYNDSNHKIITDMLYTGELVFSDLAYDYLTIDNHPSFVRSKYSDRSIDQLIDNCFFIKLITIDFVECFHYMNKQNSARDIIEATFEKIA